MERERDDVLRGTTRKRRRCGRGSASAPGARRATAVERAIAARRRRRARARVERRVQPRAVDRLQQVVDRLQLERIDRVLVERRAEDDRGPRPAKRRRHFESAAAGHLNVEQHQIGRELGDALDRLHAVFGLADDLDICAPRAAAAAARAPAARRPRAACESVSDLMGQSFAFTTSTVTSSCPAARRDARGPRRGCAAQSSAAARCGLPSSESASRVAELLVGVVERLGHAVTVGDHTAPGIEREACVPKRRRFEQAQGRARWRRCAGVRRCPGEHQHRRVSGVDERRVGAATHRARGRSRSRSGRRRWWRRASRLTAATRFRARGALARAAVSMRACRLEATRPAGMPLPDASPSSKPTRMTWPDAPAAPDESSRRNRRRRRAPAATPPRNRSRESPAAARPHVRLHGRRRAIRAPGPSVASRSRTRSSVAASLARVIGFSR